MAREQPEGQNGQRSTAKRLSRRQVLATLSIGVGGVAGCSSGGNGNETTIHETTILDEDRHGVATETATQVERTSTPEESDWPMFRADPGNTGSTTDTGPGPEAKIAWIWESPGSATTNRTVPGNVQIVVTDGTAYVPESVAYAEETNSRVRLYAFDAASGDQQWFYEREFGAPGDETSGANHSMPAVVDDRVVFLVTTDLGQDWWYVAVDERGQVAWTASQDARDTGANPKFQPVVLPDETLLVGVGPMGYQRLDPEDGEFIGDPVGTTRRPAISEGSRFALYSDGLQRYPLSGRDPDWTYDWRARDIVATYATPSIYSNGSIYFAVGEDHLPVEEGPEIPQAWYPRVFALDAETGTEHWTHVYEPERGERRSVENTDTEYWDLYGMPNGMVVTPDTVYVETVAGDVRALSVADGSLRWQISIGDRNLDLSAYGDFVAGANGVYAALPGKLVHVSKDGRSSTLSTGEYGDVGLSLAEGRLYVASRDWVEVYE